MKNGNMKITRLGKLAGYDVGITELVCENHDELKYYNLSFNT